MNRKSIRRHDALPLRRWHPALLLVCLLAVQSILTAQPIEQPQWEAAKSFVLIARSVGSTGATTLIGNAGILDAKELPGFPPGRLNGTVSYGEEALSAAAEASAIAGDIAGMPCVPLKALSEGQALQPGVYCFDQLTVTGTLSLDAGDNPDAFWIFNVTGDFALSPGATVELLKQANPARVTWRVSGNVTIGIAARMAGSIIAGGNVAFDALASLDGRAIALDGVISLNENRIVFSMTGPDMTGWDVYTNPDKFAMLSGAGQALLMKKFGGKEGNIIGGFTGKGGKTMQGAGEPTPSASGPGADPSLLSALPNVLVNNPGLDATQNDTQSESTIVLGSGSNIVAGFNDSNSFTVGGNKFTGFSRSTDGGATWIDMGELPASANGDAGDPVLARDNVSGRIYYSTLMFSGSGIQIFRSDNNGATMQAPVNGAPGHSGFQDKEWIAVDNAVGAGQGNVYLVFRDFGPGNGVYFHRSTDGGATWSNPGIAIEVGCNQGAFVTVGADHAVYVYWFACPSIPYQIRMKKSTDFGQTFGSTVTVGTLQTTGTNGSLGLEFRSNSFPHAVASPTNANLHYVIHNDNPAGVDRGNVYLRSSADGGATWSAAQQLNTDGTTTDQFFPTLAISPDGTKLGTGWYDRRRDPVNKLIERWGANATISGTTATFGSNFRIGTQFPAVFGVDPVVNSTYMGDYDQIVADNAFFYSVWSDNRDNATFPGANRKNQNIRFAKIPAAGPGPILDYVSSAISGGNANGSVDPNECNSLTVTLINNGSATASLVSAALTTSTGNVTIFDSPQDYPGIAAGASGTNAIPFRVSTSPGFVCGTPIQLTLTVTYTGGSDVVTFTLPSGSPGVATRFDNNTSTPLPDLSTTNISFNVAGFAGTIGKVTASFYANHTFDGDLTIQLISPDNTAVMLVNRRGGSGDNFGSACGDASRTILDDAAGTAISNGTAPFAGTFRPDIPLSAFNGKSGAQVNGTWTLRFVDNVGGDAGTFNCGSIFISPFSCSAAPGGCSTCTITCPANITLSNAPNQCGAVVNYPAPTTTGTCGTVTCSPASGAFFPKGTTTVNCTTTSGPSCSFTVTVNDTQPPVITCPANITMSNAPNQCGAIVNYPAPTASDNCPGVTVVCSPASGSFFPKGTTTTTCTATDASSNTATCSFTITVNDTQPPSITCPANITRSNDPGQCSAVVTYPPPVVSDNCPGVQVPACAPVSGSTFPKGVTPVVCTTFDASGNSATCSFTITVNDTELPQITAPGPLTLFTDFGVCGKYKVNLNLGTPLVSDNCPGVTYFNNAPNLFPVGTTTVTWTALDASGNTRTATQSVTIIDNQPPSVNAYLTPSTLVPANQTMRSINANMTVTDNCPGVTFVLYSVSSSNPDAGTFSGDLPNDIQGAGLNTPDTQFLLRAERAWSSRTYTVKYKGTDASNNTTMNTRLVVVPVYAASGGYVSKDPDADNTTPQMVTLDQNYPNPFNPATVIRYAIPADGHVRLTVYDVLSRRIAMLADEQQAAGSYTATFDGSSLPSGLYTYVLEANGTILKKTMSLVK